MNRTHIVLSDRRGSEPQRLGVSDRSALKAPADRNPISFASLGKPLTSKELATVRALLRQGEEEAFDPVFSAFAHAQKLQVWLGRIAVNSDMELQLVSAWDKAIDKLIDNEKRQAANIGEKKAFGDMALKQAWRGCYDARPRSAFASASKKTLDRLLYIIGNHRPSSALKARTAWAIESISSLEFGRRQKNKDRQQRMGALAYDFIFDIGEKNSWESLSPLLMLYVQTKDMPSLHDKVMRRWLRLAYDGAVGESSWLYLREMRDALRRYDLSETFKAKIKLMYKTFGEKESPKPQRAPLRSDKETRPKRKIIEFRPRSW